MTDSSSHCEPFMVVGQVECVLMIGPPQERPIPLTDLFASDWYIGAGHVERERERERERAMPRFLHSVSE